MAQMIVTIDPKGTVKVEAAGVKGASCEALTAAMERALGTPGGRELKPERFVTEEQAQAQG